MISQIADMAVDVFAERGYDKTTVEDICAVAGISRTSFFRYFRSKEDVLMHDFADLGDLLLGHLQAQPDDVTPWAALRGAIMPLADRYDGDAAHRTRRTLTLVIETASLGAFHQNKLASWQRQLNPEMARRLGTEPNDLTDPRPNALTAAAFACMDAALAAWVTADGGERLDGLLHRALAAIG